MFPLFQVVDIFMKVIATDDISVIDGTDWMKIFDGALSLADDVLTKLKVMYCYVSLKQFVKPSS